MDQYAQLPSDLLSQCSSWSAVFNSVPSHWFCSAHLWDLCASFAPYICSCGQDMPPSVVSLIIVLHCELNQCFPPLTVGLGHCNLNQSHAHCSLVLNCFPSSHTGTFFLSDATLRLSSPIVGGALGRFPPQLHLRNWHTGRTWLPNRTRDNVLYHSPFIHESPSHLNCHAMQCCISLLHSSYHSTIWEATCR